MAFSTLNNNEVLAQVQLLARSGHIKWTTHVQERMVERGFSKGQVKQCLTTGFFTEQPTIPNAFGDIQYKFNMSSTVDGEFITVVASLYPNSNVLIITVIDA